MFHSANINIMTVSKMVLSDPTIVTATINLCTFFLEITSFDKHVTATQYPENM